MLLSSTFSGAVAGNALGIRVPELGYALLDRFARFRTLGLDPTRFAETLILGSAE